MDDDFQKFFSTIAEAIVFATLLVCFGKYLTNAYLFLFLGIVALAILTLEFYRHEEIRRKDSALRHLKECSLHQINKETMKRRERQSIVKGKSRNISSSAEIAAAKKKNKKEATHKRSPKTLSVHTTQLATNNNNNNNISNNNIYAESDEKAAPVPILKRKVNLRQRLKSKMDRAIEMTKRKSLPADFFENNELSKSRSNHNSMEILDNG